MSLKLALTASLTLHLLLLALPGGSFVPHPGIGEQITPASAAPPRIPAQRSLLTVRFHGATPNTSTFPDHETNSQPASASPSASEPRTATPAEQAQTTSPSSRESKPTPAAPGIALGIPTPHYYSRKEVERPPQIIEDINAEDGRLDQQLSTQTDGGAIILELWINENGDIDKIEPLVSAMSQPLAGLIIDNFAKARFLPAQLDGQAVKSRMKIEVIVQPKTEAPTTSDKD